MTPITEVPSLTGAGATAQTLTDDHEKIRQSWELPAYTKPTEEPTSRLPLLVGLVAGGLGLAVGAALGYAAQSATIDELQAAAPVVVAVSPGYSWAHDSTIPVLVPSGYSWGHDSTIPVAASGYSSTHDSTIPTAASTATWSSTHDSRIVVA